MISHMGLDIQGYAFKERFLHANDMGGDGHILKHGSNYRSERQLTFHCHSGYNEFNHDQKHNDIYEAKPDPLPMPGSWS